MKDKHIKAYMKAAYVFAELSSCKRRQVGCVVVKDDTIISIGYNGTPSGWSNICEDSEGNTKPEVLHAEENAIIKLTRSHESAEDAIMFITTAPCFPCAKLIAETGIKIVYYADDYRGTEGIEHLRARDITVTKK